jgi:hypothetical protein
MTTHRAPYIAEPSLWNIEPFESPRGQ